MIGINKNPVNPVHLVRKAPPQVAKFFAASGVEGDLKWR